MCINKKGRRLIWEMSVYIAGGECYGERHKGFKMWGGFDVDFWGNWGERELQAVKGRFFCCIFGGSSGRIEAVKMRCSGGRSDSLEFANRDF